MVKVNHKYSAQAAKLKRRAAALKGWQNKKIAAQVEKATWMNEAEDYDLTQMQQEIPIANPNLATNILTEAAGIVGGVRQTTHGAKERSFIAISELWNTYLRNRVLPDGTDSSISPVDVAQMMVLLKIARSIQGKPARDHYLDEAGYAAIAGELASK
jgi:hypothetical protein